LVGPPSGPGRAIFPQVFAAVPHQFVTKIGELEIRRVRGMQAFGQAIEVALGLPGVFGKGIQRVVVAIEEFGQPRDLLDPDHARQ
jgi:hypothetical protein